MNIPRFGRPDYDPNEIAKDGPFRAPRVWLHVQKVLIACTVYAFALTCFRTFDVAAAGAIAAAVALLGPLLFSGIRERVAPTDPEPHTVAEHLLDWSTDGSLYAVPVYLELCAEGRGILGAIVLGVLGAVYYLCRNGARP